MPKTQLPKPVLSLCIVSCFIVRLLLDKNKNDLRIIMNEKRFIKINEQKCIE